MLGGASWKDYFNQFGLNNLSCKNDPDHVERFCEFFPHCSLSLHSFIFYYHLCTVYGQNNGNACFILGCFAVLADSLLGFHGQSLLT